MVPSGLRLPGSGPSIETMSSPTPSKSSSHCLLVFAMPPKVIIERSIKAEIAGTRVFGST